MYNSVYKPLVNAETWTILPLLLRPRSTGRVSLRSKDPLVYPVIEPMYFRHREDVLTLIEGIRIAMAVSSNSSENHLSYNFLLDIQHVSISNLRLSAPYHPPTRLQQIPSLQRRLLGVQSSSLHFHNLSPHQYLQNGT